LAESARQGAVGGALRRRTRKWEPDRCHSHCYQCGRPRRLQGQGQAGRGGVATVAPNSRTARVRTDASSPRRISTRAKLFQSDPGRAGQRSADVTPKVATLGGLPKPRWPARIALHRAAQRRLAWRAQAGRRPARGLRCARVS